jgi:hypothetical protein
MHIHAIGDRGVKESLDAIEAAQVQNSSRASTRHLLTHVENVKAADFSRFKSLNVSANMQLAGDFTKPENFSEMTPIIGERAAHQMPIKTLYDAGARITLSSDWDVSSLSPFVAIQNALTRGDQSMPSLDAVIRAYTIDNAYLMRQEQQTGSIQLGKYGDLVMVDQNIFNVPVSEIGKTKVLYTILSGEVIYDSSKPN